MGFVSKIKEGLAKTTKNISAQLGGIIAAFTGADDEFYEELEETLILADLGAQTATDIVDKLRETVKQNGFRTSDEIKTALTDILSDLLDTGDCGLKLGTKPSVILVIGVNGVGKTTTIGKLAVRFISEGKKVLLCAGDTFRAAAAEALLRAAWPVGRRVCRAGPSRGRPKKGQEPEERQRL